MELKVCDWTMEIDDEIWNEAISYNGKTNEAGYLVAVNKRSKAVELGGQCYLKACEFIAGEFKKGLTVWEGFGGIGRSSLIIHKVMYPFYHVVVEIDELCVRHLRSLSFIDELHHGDGYETIVGSECFFVDAYHSTLTNWLRDQRWIEFIHNICNYDPMVILITDSAISKLHLNYDAYNTMLSLFGLKADLNSLESYCKSIGKVLKKSYKQPYDLARVYSHSTASYLLFVRSDLGEYETEFVSIGVE